MENRTINIFTVAEVAKALRELKEQMVFIGGAVVSLYADDSSADEIRPTADIDLTINLMNFKGVLLIIAYMPISRYSIDAQPF